MPLNPEKHGRDGAFAIVLGFWLALTLLNVLYVALFIPNLPFQDDFALLPVLYEQQPLSVGWLWEPVQEHRMPFVRLAIWAIAWVTESDFRINYLLHAGILSLGGLIPLLALRKDRGYTRLSDWIVPIFCMSWIHWWNIRQLICLAFVLYLLIVMTMLSAIAVRFWRSTAWTLVVCGSMIMLPHLASQGLLLSICFAPYAVYCGQALLREERPGDRRRGILLLGASLISGMAVGLYLVSTPSVRANLSGTKSIWNVVTTGLKSVSMSLGTVVESGWEVSEPGMAGLTALALTCVVLIAGTCLRRESAPRLRSLGLAALLAGILSISVAIGFSRSDRGFYGGLAYWYATLSAPIPVIVYVLVDRNQNVSLSIRRFVNGVLMPISLFVLLTSISTGWEIGQSLKDAAGRMRQDIRAGYDFGEVAKRYQADFCIPSADALEMGLVMMDKLGRGILVPDAREWLVPLPEMEFRNVDLKGWKEGKPSVRPVSGGSTRMLGVGVLLETEGEETAFRVAKLDVRGRGGVIIRVDILSAAESTARLLGVRNASTGEPDQIVAEAPCRVGANSLTFVFNDADISNREWLLIPGARGARYRLQSIDRLELPLEIPGDLGRRKRSP